ncbi:NAD(P)-dependent oxidoreductase [Streptomyces tremellae]|uniref:UDP-glucose 4-epimerase GalE n=1 Tax=Streptomyces tremellae TaxID=1124239 RepID=A0ABP7EWJ0_9ACTN
MSVIVLGASGFVGRAVCEAFAARGGRVLGISRSPVPEPLPAPSGTVRYRRLSLTRSPVHEVAALLYAHAADVVVNAAGAVWGVSAEQLEEGNVTLTRRLLSALAGLDSPQRPRLIHLGSAQEYGPGTPGLAVREDTPPRPVSAYGRAKLLATEAVLAAVREGRVDATVLRVANVCGPRSPRNSLLGLIAAHLAEAARNPGTPPAPLRLAPLRARLDFVDVRDVASAVARAADAPPHERLLNIGRGEAVSVSTLVAGLIGLSGLDMPVVERSPAHTDRNGIEWQQLDTERARTLLGWKPAHSLEESLKDLLAAAHRQEPDARIGLGLR